MYLPSPISRRALDFSFSAYNLNFWCVVALTHNINSDEIECEKMTVTLDEYDVTDVLADEIVMEIVEKAIVLYRRDEHLPFQDNTEEQ